MQENCEFYELKKKLNHNFFPGKTNIASDGVFIKRIEHEIHI